MVVTRDSLTPIDFGELHILDYTAGHDLSSSLAVIEVPAGASHPEAWSERSDKYYLTIAGAIQFELERRVYYLSPGDFCLVRQGQRFAYSNPTNDPATLVLCTRRTSSSGQRDLPRHGSSKRTMRARPNVRSFGIRRCA